MFATRILLTIASFTLLESVAYGYSMTHDYYSRYRPQYGSNVYLSQQLQYGRSDATVEHRKTGIEPAASSVPSNSTNFNGYVLNSSVGLEHFRFLHTGLFYSNVQQTSVKTSTVDLRGHEAGAEVKLVLQSPVANVMVGGGIFYASQVYGESLARHNLTGSGYKASLEVAYFASSNVSLVVSGNRVVESLRDKSEQQSVRALSVNSDRVGAGINIWL